MAGDFGLVWYPPEHPSYKEDLYWKKWLEAKPFTILFVDGNHENFDMLYQFPIVNKFGAPVHQIGRNIFHLIRGNIYTINDKKIFAFGGAKSHDRGPGDGWWWPQEIPTYAEMEFGVNNLNKIGNKVDVIISHDGPQTALNNMLGYRLENDEIRRYFEFIANQTCFDNWYFGHHHIDKDIDRFHCLYDRILKID